MSHLETLDTDSSLYSEKDIFVQDILDDISSKIWEVVNLIDDNEHISIETQSWTFIGEIYTWRVCIWDDIEESHLWIEVGEDFRNKWVGTKLYELWQELWYELPEFEYTGNPDKIRFFQKIGYTPVSIIHRETGQRQEIGSENYLDMIPEWYIWEFVLEE